MQLILFLISNYITLKYLIRNMHLLNFKINSNYNLSTTIFVMNFLASINFSFSNNFLLNARHLLFVF